MLLVVGCCVQIAPAVHVLPQHMPLGMGLEKEPMQACSLLQIGVVQTTEEVIELEETSIKSSAVEQSPLSGSFREGGFMDQFDDAMNSVNRTKPCNEVQSISSTNQSGDAQNVETTATNLTTVANEISRNSTKRSQVNTVRWHSELPTVRNVVYNATADPQTVFTADHEYIEYLENKAKLQPLKEVGTDVHAERWAPGWIEQGMLPSASFFNSTTWANMPYLKQVNDQSDYKNVTSDRSLLYDRTAPYAPLYLGYDSSYVQESERPN